MTRPAMPGSFLSRRTLVAGTAMLLLAAVFVLARFEFAADDHLGAFIVRGSIYTDAAAAPKTLGSVQAGDGYDGQFYYRMALEPTDLANAGHGLLLDSGLRRGRIGYSVLSYLVAMGQPSLIPAAMVVVNVLSLALAGWCGAVLAQLSGRSPWCGLLPAGFGGLVTSLARDLTEPTAVAFLLVALVALRKGRPLSAAAAMTTAALCRETALLLPLALLTVAVVGAVAGRRRWDALDALWLAPIAGWTGWQVFCAATYGSVPVLDERGVADTPFAAAFQEVIRWLGHPSVTHLLLLAQLGALLLVVGLAVWAGRAGSQAYVLVALVLSGILVLSLSSKVWNDDVAEYRTFADVHLYGTVALLTTPRTRLLSLAAVSTLLIWLVTVVLRVHDL